MTDAPLTDSPTAPAARRRKTRNLVEAVREGLRKEILSGAVTPGEKLPSEAQLTARFGVSRTVVREAIASLRVDGMVEARQGAGVFVLKYAAPSAPPFDNLDVEKISHMIEMLELRSSVEIEAAGLAAARCSAAQEEEIMQRLLAVEALSAEGHATVEADLNLHLAIADATNNRRFRDFLEMLGRNMIPRTALQRSDKEAAPPAYMAQIAAEHRAIFNAIAARDEDGARAAMRTHLKGSLQRYRGLLRRNEQN